jgi:predicted Zn-dependent protease with MMP-like domain
MATGSFPAASWAPMQAPTLEDFEAMAAAAYDGLPESFRKLCADLVIEVTDFPDDDTMEEMDCETPFDLLGLFRGIGLAQAPATLETGRFPNMVWLYRRPILDYWAEHEDMLGDIISHVLIHEIGHHFGLSDDDMERIEAGAAG